MSLNHTISTTNSDSEDCGAPMSKAVLDLPTKLSLIHSVYERSLLPDVSICELLIFIQACIDLNNVLQKEIRENQPPVVLALVGGWRQKRIAEANKRATELENDRRLMENVASVVEEGLEVDILKVALRSLLGRTSE